jgi:hypothetical protein
MTPVTTAPAWSTARRTETPPEIENTVQWGGSREAPPLIRLGRYQTKASCYKLLAYCWKIPVTASLQVMPRLTRVSNLIENLDDLLNAQARI